MAHGNGTLSPLFTAQHKKVGVFGMLVIWILCSIFHRFKGHASVGALTS